MFLRNTKRETEDMVQLKNKHKFINKINCLSSYIKKFFLSVVMLSFLDSCFHRYSDLQRRVKSAVVLFVFGLLTFIGSTIPVNCLFVVLGIIMLFEWDRMFNKNAVFMKIKVSIFFLINVFVYFLSLVCVFFLNSYTLSFGVLILGFVVSMFVLIAYGKNNFVLEAIPSIYISSAVISSLFLYNRYGLAVLLFLFVITISTDTCAYFTGSYLGGKKLMPSLSPNKTISGAIGGIIGSFIFSCLYLLILFILGYSDTILNLHLFAVISVVLSILSQCGDLFESYCKRICEVKDSGTLISGHGGLLDRFDSFISIVPVYSMMVVLSLSLL